MQKQKTCLIEGCHKEPTARGLCSSDYQMAHYMVSAGKTTWAQLEKIGMSSAAGVARGRFIKQFNKLK